VCSAPLYWGSQREKQGRCTRNSESTPLGVLLLFIAEIITLPVVETNHCCHQFVENSDDGPSPECEVTKAEMFAFLALTLQMGHTVQGRLEDYWTKMEQLRTPFCGQPMACAFYISRTIIGMELTEQMTDCGKYETFEIVRTNFSKFYNPSKHLAVDEIIVKFKGRLVFKQYIPKKTQTFRHQNVQTM